MLRALRRALASGAGGRLARLATVTGRATVAAAAAAAAGAGAATTGAATLGATAALSGAAIAPRAIASASSPSWRSKTTACTVASRGSITWSFVRPTESSRSAAWLNTSFARDGRPIAFSTAARRSPTVLLTGMLTVMVCPSSSSRSASQSEPFSFSKSGVSNSASSAWQLFTSSPVMSAMSRMKSASTLSSHAGLTPPASAHVEAMSASEGDARVMAW
mmetsp:Transcript_4902/g.13340  ORF Transcript_4902/g.13340 Transcript_4902/m.13340 type:complete len:219 (+) Transcript_4902:255-911(+)